MKRYRSTSEASRGGGTPAASPAGRGSSPSGSIGVVLGALLCVASVASLGACNKPELEDCRKAIANMQKLLGTEEAAKNVDNEGEVRRCKGGSSRQAVACAIKAATLDELKACEFMGSKKK
jgi:hypothetical protein